MGVGITAAYAKKIKALKAHESQIRSGDMEWVETRHGQYGKQLGVAWGELFYTERSVNKLPSIFEEL